MRVTQIVEALLFSSDAPLAASDFARADERLDEDTVSAAVDVLRQEYDESGRAFQVIEIAGGYQLLTKPEYAGVLERFDTVPRATRLSSPALEVLAIIAYRQPIGRIEIEEIRGVQSTAVLRTLQDRELIEPVGRGEGLGRPLLYGTTRQFMEHFGFRSLDDMPRPDELPVVLREKPLELPITAEPVSNGATEQGDAGQPNGGAADSSAHASDSAAPTGEADTDDGVRGESESVGGADASVAVPGSGPVTGNGAEPAAPE